MRRATAIALAAGALLGAPAVAAAASVDLMVVGKSATLAEPAAVTLKTQRPKVGGRRCTVGARTALAALLRTPLRVKLSDYGSCGRSSRDAGGLFVRRVGPDANRGQDGWVYKVGRKAGTAGAGDSAGAFGDGRRLRDGQRVVWFWCELSRGSCQRTLEVSPVPGEVAVGQAIDVTVTGYDDAGKGVKVEGATVRLGDATATTGAAGVATITPPPGATGTYDLHAEKDGAIRSFAREVTVR